MYSLYVTKTGEENRPILFLHGLWGGGNYFREFDLSKIADGPKYFPDELGFGKSPKPNINYTPKVHCDAIINSLPKDIKFTVVGHSFGTVLAYNLAKYYPERIEKLVFISPVMYTSIEEAKKHLSTVLINKIVINWPSLASLICFFSCRLKLGGLIYPLFVSKLQKTYQRHLVEHTWHSFYSTFGECLLFEPTFPIAQLSVQNCPTLLVAGAADNYVQPQTIAKLASARLTKVVVPGFGHNLLFDQFEGTLEMIGNWLEQDR